jgi:hypothetical protein
MECPEEYVEQTGRTFDIRYKEHIHDIRRNNGNTGYANHILNTENTYGTKTITTGKNGRHLNALGRYYIYKTSKENILYADVNQLGDNIDTIKRNTQTLTDASKEIGLEVNTYLLTYSWS